MPERPQWERPGVLEVMVMIAVPIVGLIWLDWSAIQVLLLYWFESAIMGGFTLVRMALARPVYESQADFIAAHPWMLQHYPISDEEWRQAQTRPVARNSSLKQFLIPLFLGHYTFFLGVHAFLLATLIAQLPARRWWTLFTAEWNWALAIALISMVVAHGYRFWRDDLQGHTYTRTFPFLAMIYPYRQLLVLHLALLLGGLALVFFSLPPSVAVLLIFLKAAFDLNWIRIPIGPEKIDWGKMAEHDRKSTAGKIQRRTVRSQPAESRCEVRDDGARFQVIIPPRGVREVSRKMRAGGCMLVGLIALGFASVFTFGFLGSYAHGILRGAESGYWPLLIVLTVFQALATLWLLVLSVLVSVPVSVLRYGRVRGVIDLTADKLAVEEKGVLLRRRREVALSQIADFGMSPTGNATNEFKVVQLRFRLRDGRELAFFTGRDADELNWIATVLRERIERIGPAA